MADMIGFQQTMRRMEAIQKDARSGAILKKLANAVVQQEKALAPVKTGNLKRSIHVGAVSGLSAQVVASANYAAYVEHGTGLFGPYHHRIVPVHAKALRWAVGQGGAGGPELRLTGSRRTRKGQALGAWAFARSVKGAHAQPYMVPGARRAIEASPLRDSVGASLISAWNDAA